jgi:hypothetical protein
MSSGGTILNNIAKIKSIEAHHKRILLELNQELNDNSGIYFLTRTDENGIRYAYIGQAKHILTRLAQHCVGYQHIDLSLRKHGFYTDTTVCGWKIGFLNYPESKLDELEQHYIKAYAQSGYQLRNKTAGGQGQGKQQIDEYRPAKGYRDGVRQGYLNASREVAHMFDKHLNFSTKSDKPNKNQDKAAMKFREFMEFCKRSDVDEHS